MIIIFLFGSLKWMRRSQFSDWNDVKQFVFMAIFSNLINLLFVLPLERFDIKNELLQFNAHVVMHDVINVFFHTVIFCAVESNVNITIGYNWQIYFAYWVFMVIHIVSLYAINKYLHSNIDFHLQIWYNIESFFRYIKTNPYLGLLKSFKQGNNNYNDAIFTMKNPLVTIIGIHIGKQGKQKKTFANIKRDFKNAVFTFNTLLGYSIFYQTKSFEYEYVPLKHTFNISSKNAFSKWRKQWTVNEICEFYHESIEMCVEKGHDSMINVISCYCDENGNFVYDSQKEKEPVLDILKTFINCKQLKNKPKLFFIDSCSLKTQSTFASTLSLSESIQMDDMLQNAPDFRILFYNIDKLISTNMNDTNKKKGKKRNEKNVKGGYLLRGLKKTFSNPKQLHNQRFDQVFFQIGTKAKRFAHNVHVECEFQDINHMAKNIQFYKHVVH